MHQSQGDASVSGRRSQPARDGRAGCRREEARERLVHDDASQVMLMKLNVPSVNSHKERRIRERIDVFGESTRTSAKVPTSAKDSVGLVLNALLSARILDRDPKISNMTPADLPLGRLQLNEGCKLEDPVALRIS